jgi:hypothetical protein
MNILFLHWFYLLLLGIWNSNALSSPNAYTNRYINKEQWKKIKEILQHPETTPVMKSQLHNQIYNHYHKWAQYKAYQFKKYHSHKCRAISLQELNIYSQRGLYQAIQKYNGRSRFLSYANLFVMGELYRGMTELQPVTLLSKSIRRRKPKPTPAQKRRRSETQFVGENEWLWDKLSPISSIALCKHPIAHYLEKEEEQDGYRNIWEKVIELEPITRQIFLMKYGVLLDGEKSNRKIGESLGYSEVFVRLKIQQIKAQFPLCYLTTNRKIETEEK